MTQAWQSLIDKAAVVWFGDSHVVGRKKELKVVVEKGASVEHQEKKNESGVSTIAGDISKLDGETVAAIQGSITKLDVRAPPPQETLTTIDTNIDVIIGKVVNEDCLKDGKLGVFITLLKALKDVDNGHGRFRALIFLEPLEVLLGLWDRLQVALSLENGTWLDTAGEPLKDVKVLMQFFQRGFASLSKIREASDDDQKEHKG